MITTLGKSDYVGAVTGTLCLIHCLATPFLFFATSSYTVTYSSASPIWWQYMDYLFLLVSFIAVYQTTRTVTKMGLKIGFWLSWFLLLLMILNERFEWDYLVEGTIIPTSTLVLLHVYNLKYCQCNTDKCCTNIK